MVLDGGIQQKRTCTIPKWNTSESHVLCLPTQIPQESVHISISLGNADLWKGLFYMWGDTNTPSPEAQQNLSEIAQ